MEQLPERQRLPGNHMRMGLRFSPQKNLQNDHNEHSESEDMEEIGEGELVEKELISDNQLQQRRALLDYKLKCTFESIFAKYEKNFDAIGDVINLETGHIEVDNGHILQMRDERDVGDISRARQRQRRVSEEVSEDQSIFLEGAQTFESEDEEEDADFEEHCSDDEDNIESSDDADEDDLILRGLCRANRFRKHSQHLSSLRSTSTPSMDLASSIPKNAIPSSSSNFAKLGAEFGPPIVEYVSNNQAHQESQIEKAWRVPDLPKAQQERYIEPAWQVPDFPKSQQDKYIKTSLRISEIPRAPICKRPIAKLASHLLAEMERSTSPETGSSLWAQRPGERRRLDQTENDAICKGQNVETKPRRFHPKIGQIWTTFNPNEASDYSGPKRRRRKWTDADDALMLERVKDGNRRGHHMTRIFKDLEDEVRKFTSYAEWRLIHEIKHPGTSWRAWKKRYYRKFTYPSKLKQVLDPEISIAKKSSTDAPKFEKAAHPNNSTLEKSQGRVDPRLLEHNAFSKTVNEQIGDCTPISEHVDSYFMSPPKTQPQIPSNRVVTSCSYSDRIYPAQGSELTFTPITTVSSFSRNHWSSSAAPAIFSEDDSKKSRADERHLAVNSRQAEEINPCQERQLLGSKKWHSQISSNKLCGPMNSWEKLAENSASSENPLEAALETSDIVVASKCYMDNLSNKFSVAHDAIARGKPLPLQKTKETAKNQPGIVSHASIKSEELSHSDPMPIAMSGKISMPEKPAAFSVIETGHQEKSDADLSPFSAHDKLTVKSSERLQLATPENKKFCKAILKKVLTSDELDELSLAAEDSRLISSKPALKSPKVCIKTEVTTKSQTPSLSLSKKRKQSVLRENNDVDELAPLPAFYVSTKDKSVISPEQGSSLVRNRKIKTEDTTSKITLPRNPKNITTIRGSIQSYAKYHSGSSERNFLRIATPLLDLTPSHSRTGDGKKQREVRDSIGDSLSSEIPASPPLAGLLTPVRNQNRHKYPIKLSEYLVTVATSHGLRTCGRDGFVCGRSFCFQCGMATAVASG